MIDGFKTGKDANRPRRPLKIQREETPRAPAFRTPEEVAKTDEKLPAKPDTTPSFVTKPPVKKQWRSPIAWFKDLSRKKKILFVVLVLALIAGIAFGVKALMTKPAPAPAVVVEEKKAEEPKATPIYSPLTGVAVSKEQSELPVTGIMIENSPDARPQSGLHQAGVVFEAIAEGGITRFLTLWQEAQPDYVGPVRSVRPYYVDWLEGFDAAIAHVGGSPEALAKIRSDGVKDLDQFYNTGPYRRVNNRYAPHNMYTSLPLLTDLQKSKGWTKSTFTGFPRKAEKPSDAPTARAIDIVISGALYNVHYDYDVTSNSYKRVLAGKAHVDERSKTQISPKVVIAIVVPYSIHGDGIHSVYQTIGSGKTFVFQDGVATEGTWEKTSSKSQITFKDAAGKPIELNAGQTWITATSIANNVTYKP
jgi:hypothetical protein